MKHYRVILESAATHNDIPLIKAEVSVWAESEERADDTAYHYLTYGTILGMNVKEVCELAQ